MVHISSVVLAATVAFFAIGTTLALPIEERSISTRENVDDLESRFFGALIGAAVRIGAKVGGKVGGKAGKHYAKHEAKKHADNRRNRKHRRGELTARDVDDIDEVAARDFDTNDLEVYGRDLEFDELD